jgi:PIN domain nuclease of toxin-antitoxin system
VRVVADTHALVCFLAGDQRLSARARKVLHHAQQDPDGGIIVSVASRLDLHYLQRTGRSGPADVQPRGGLNAASVRCRTVQLVAQGLGTATDGT